VPVNFWDSASGACAPNCGWIQPAGSVIYGTGPSGYLEDGTKGFAIVACTSTISSVCPNAFPNDTPLHAFVSANTSYSYSASAKATQLWWATIDCAYVQGVRGHMNYFAQENAGVFHSTVENCANNGIGLDIGSGSSSSDTSSNSSYEVLNLVDGEAPTGSGAATCTAGALNIRFTNTTSQYGPKSMKDITATHNQCINPSGPDFYPNHNIEINGNATDWEGELHVESAGGNSSNHVQFGTITLLGSVSTSGFSVTYVSGDDWPAGCSGTIYISNSAYTIATCTGGSSLTVMSSPGTHTDVPYSLDTVGGAQSQKIEKHDRQQLRKHWHPWADRHHCGLDDQHH